MKLHSHWSYAPSASTEASGTTSAVGAERVLHHAPSLGSLNKAVGMTGMSPTAS